MINSFGFVVNRGLASSPLSKDRFVQGTPFPEVDLSGKGGERILDVFDSVCSRTFVVAPVPALLSNNQRRVDETIFIPGEESQDGQTTVIT
jgi:hypothetical protein